MRETVGWIPLKYSRTVRGVIYTHALIRYKILTIKHLINALASSLTRCGRRHKVLTMGPQESTKRCALQNNERNNTIIVEQTQIQQHSLQGVDTHACPVTWTLLEYDKNGYSS